MSNLGEEAADGADEHSTHLCWVPRSPLGGSRATDLLRPGLGPLCSFLLVFRPALASLNPLRATYIQYSPPSTVLDLGEFIHLILIIEGISRESLCGISLYVL